MLYRLFLFGDGLQPLGEGCSSRSEKINVRSSHLLSRGSRSGPGLSAFNHLAGYLESL